MSEHFLVTGAMGCIGAWIVRNLVRDGAEVTAYDMATDDARLRLIMSADELGSVRFLKGDITDLDTLATTLKSRGITHIIHLAALQVPACKANPPLGARVNVLGTINVFEAALRVGLKRVVYASSVAVYGLREEYPEGLLSHNAPLKPRTLYGVYKQANESAAKVYWWDQGLSSIGLRPYVLYGPGRDQGMTSTPTKAMLAVAAGRPYHITYGGRCGMQYTDDVARMFIAAARVPFEGAEVFHVKGDVVTMEEVIAAIEMAAPEAKGTLTFTPAPLPFPDGQDDTELQRLLGTIPHTPLVEGIAATIETFRAALSDGRISAEGI